MKNWTQSLSLLLPILLAGCPSKKTETTQSDVTAAEAAQALEESTVETQGQTLAAEHIEVATTFTIGQAVQAAAQELSTFVTSQLPCAQVSLADSTLTITYAATGTSCLYHGKVITGTSEITVVKNDVGEIQVDHQWTALSNGLVQIDGTATVTWSSANKSRHVVHELVIERLRDHKIVDSTGDRLQSALNGDLATGIAVTGTRSWTSSNGTWDLVINDVQMRWIDPVPEAGSYSLTTPRSKTLNLGFARKDSDTISVTLTGGRRPFVFDVTAAGDAKAQ